MEDFKAKTLSFRQWTILVALDKPMKISLFMALYKNTGMSLIKRDYVEFNLQAETVFRSARGNEEIRLFRYTKLSDLQVERDSETRASRYHADILKQVQRLGKQRPNSKPVLKINTKQAIVA